MTAALRACAEPVGTTRRRVLAGLALLPLGAATLGMPGCARRTPISRALLELLERELAMPDPLAIGRAVVAATPGSLDPLELWQRVLDGLPLSDATALATAWRERCREDFVAGRRLQVAGWHLCVSEGTLCAALVLEANAA